jgi:hypothetical protein
MVVVSATDLTVSFISLHCCYETGPSQRNDEKHYLIPTSQKGVENRVNRRGAPPRIAVRVHRNTKEFQASANPPLYTCGKNSARALSMASLDGYRLLGNPSRRYLYRHITVGFSQNLRPFCTFNDFNTTSTVRVSLTTFVLAGRLINSLDTFPPTLLTAVLDASCSSKYITTYSFQRRLNNLIWHMHRTQRQREYRNL